MVYLALIAVALLARIAWLLGSKEVPMPRRRPDPFERIAIASEKSVEELAGVRCTLGVIAGILEGAAPGPQGLNLSILEFHGRSLNMPHEPLPPVVLKDSEKVLVAVAPLLANGEPDTTVDVTWESSDPSVGIEEQADGRSAYILTPGESGSATITVTAQGYESETLSVSYEPGAPRHLNLSVGTPEPDA